MNIAGLLEDRARSEGDRPAIVDRRGTVGFAELDRRAASAAASLAEAGVTAGMRVLVLVPMSIALYTIVIALFRIRATAVFVDPSTTRDRLERSIRRVAPGAFVGVPRAHSLGLLSKSVRAIPIRLSVGGWVPGARTLPVGAHRPGRAIEPCRPDAPAIITFTSASTGEPKAAVRTHGFLVAQHRALVESLALAPGETDLSTLPVFVLANLAAGVTSLIPDADLRAPGAIDPAPVVSQIRAVEPVRTVASPAFLTRIISHAAREGQPLDSFLRIYTGGAPVFPGTLDAIAAVAPRAAVVAVYGSTEAEPIAKLDRREIADDDRRAMAGGAGLLAGRPVSSVRLRVLRDRWGIPVGPLELDELDAQTAEAGVAGEIVVSGDHVLTGYLDGVGDEETKILAGDCVWHRTGDAGYVDGSGRLWLLGRCSARVADEKGAVYPFAVEAAASGAAGVTRTAFMMHAGHRTLVVEAAGDRDAVRSALAARLEWAALADIMFVQRIPVDRRHNAKVDYPALARMLDCDASLGSRDRD